MDGYRALEAADASPSSSAGWIQIAVAVIGLAGLALGAWATYRAKGKEVTKSDAQQLIDQYQEGRKEDQARIAALEGRTSENETRLTKFRLYVFQLHKHINDGNPPPPPAWPEDLL